MAKLFDENEERFIEIGWAIVEIMASENDQFSL